MTAKTHTLSQKAAHGSNTAATDLQKTERPKRSGVSLQVIRLAAEEHERLNELAPGLTLSVSVFGGEAAKRKKRPKIVVEDKPAVPEELTLFAQSCIVSNHKRLT